MCCLNIVTNVITATWGARHPSDSFLPLFEFVWGAGVLGVFFSCVIVFGTIKGTFVLLAVGLGFPDRLETKRALNICAAAMGHKVLPCGIWDMSREWLVAVGARMVAKAM
jgi:hypothetical protein